MSTLGTVNYETLLRNYKAKVEEFTLHAACGRPYILISKLTQWLRSKDSFDDNFTRAGRLLKAAYKRRYEHEPIPISSDSLGPGESSYLLVFCILLLLDFGDLVNHFQRENKFDNLLPIPLFTLKNIFGECRYQAGISENDADFLASQFNEIQWRFCPAIFELRQPRNFGKDRVLPFCVKQLINLKGITASLWQVEVLEEFVGPQLRKKVPHSRYHANEKDNLGYRYQFALKTFEEGRRKTYENERRAFLRLWGHEGIVQCLTEFELKTVQSQPTEFSETASTSEDTKDKRTSTYNILLEFGECDLEEYFAQRLPPVTEQEVGAFWKGLFAVADALEGIHNLKDRNSGVLEEFYGWHADIKPENILNVQNNFKLADPGFTTFIVKEGKDPTTPVEGGTETYGAPETYLSGLKTKVTQKIDTWSLGCVFSIAATWVVLGCQGIGQFNILRRRAFEQAIKTQQSENDQLNARLLDSTDSFHDRKDVLSEVKSWHKALRRYARKTDSITAQVLDLVDREMLVGNAEHRITTEQLCAHLKEICNQIEIETNEAKALDSMLKIVMEALFVVDKGAPSRFSEEAMPERGRLASHLHPISNNSRRDRSRTGIKLMKTSHRSQTFESTFGSQSEEDRSLESSLDGQYNQNESAWLQNSRGTNLSISVLPSPQEDQNHHTDVDILPSELHRPPHKRTLSDTHHQTISEAYDELQRQILRIGSIKLKKQPKDQFLARHFSKRDILFVVDNGETMKAFWDDVKRVLETLILKARGLDEDGMDLVFTSGPCHVDRREGEGKFVKTMNDPSAIPLEGMRTDMAKTLQEILDHYMRRDNKTSSRIKNLTLIVLTDGLWQGTLNKDEVRRVVVNFLNDLERSRGKGIRLERPVSIEFIQFGWDEDATELLRYLDDELEWEGCPDIIDREYSSGNIYKMLLGSFVPGWDAEDLEVVSPAGIAANHVPQTSPPLSPQWMQRISSLHHNGDHPSMASRFPRPVSHPAFTPATPRRVRTDQGAQRYQTPTHSDQRNRASSSAQNPR